MSDFNVQKPKKKALIGFNKYHEKMVFIDSLRSLHPPQHILYNFYNIFFR